MKSLLIPLFCSVSLLATDVYAQTVKKWVDEEGVTHYSDIAPDSGRRVEEVNLPAVEEDAEDTREADDITQRIKDQAAQMELERKQREADAAAEQREQELEEALSREEIIEAPRKDKDRSKRLIPLKEPGPHISPLRERELRKNQ